MASKELPCDIYMLGIDLDEELIERAKKLKKGDGLSFLSVDIMDGGLQVPELEKYLQENLLTKFSFTFLFSVTMWIHLNHGDNGLISLLKKITDLTNGSILIEP